MSVSLKIALGTVNYTNYLRVSARKVADPGTEVYVNYIDVPVTNYTFVIPNLDPDDYYIDFRDAPDTMSLGTLVSQAFVNAQSPEFAYEKRFYTIGSLPSGASLDATRKILTDEYLLAKEVFAVFKEGFRDLEADTEYTFDDDNGAGAGVIELLTSDLSDGEKLVVTLKFNVGTVGGSTTTGPFSATISVTGATYTINPADKGKRFSLDCAGTKQVVTLCALSAIVEGDFVYLDHRRSGMQAQSKIVPAGSDKILFNGFGLGSNELTELWVAKGHSLYLRKGIISSVSYWEVISEYDGTRVGDRMASTYKSQPNWVLEDGSLYDGDEYPALWWWINSVLPSTHVVTDDTVTGGGYAHPAGKEGLFVKHSSLKKFRVPNTQGWSERGLKDFDSYGADTDRTYDYPGGTQPGKTKQFWPGSPDKPVILKVDGTFSIDSGTDADPGLTQPNLAQPLAIDKTQFGSENTVKNIGVVYLRHI